MRIKNCINIYTKLPAKPGLTGLHSQGTVELLDWRLFYKYCSNLSKPFALVYLKINNPKSTRYLLGCWSSCTAMVPCRRDPACHHTLVWFCHTCSVMLVWLSGFEYVDYLLVLWLYFIGSFLGFAEHLGSQLPLKCSGFTPWPRLWLYAFRLDTWVPLSHFSWVPCSQQLSVQGLTCPRQNNQGQGTRWHGGLVYLW